MGQFIENATPVSKTMAFNIEVPGLDVEY